jgi:hypothetical protein
LFLYRNGENKNIKEANNMPTNSRDLIIVERFFWEVHGNLEEVNQRTTDNKMANEE